MRDICKLIHEKDGVTTLKSFQFSETDYTVTTIILDSGSVYTPTIETKNFEEGIYPVKNLIDGGYKYTNPYEDEIEIKYLAPKITKRLQKLGFEANAYFDPYERKKVETTLGKRILPTAMNQFQYYNWHESGKNNLKTSIGDDDFITAVHFGILGDLSQYSDHSFEGAYYMIGHYDGGNYMLLFDLDDKNPSDPTVYRMDHDPYDEEFPVYLLCKLSEFVSKMKIEKSR
jgi:hypothetical protein